MCDHQFELIDDDGLFWVGCVKCGIDSHKWLGIQEAWDTLDNLPE